MRVGAWAFATVVLGATSGCGNSAALNHADTFDTEQDASLAGDGGYRAPKGGGVVGAAGTGTGTEAGSTTPPGGPPVTSTTEPQTCAEAAAAHSYIGCDYWPTVVSNNVWSIFDFAVVVANVGSSTAQVTVTGPVQPARTASVAPGQLAKIYLPWVPALKGPDANNCGAAVAFPGSVIVPGGAFHLVSSAPVTVYQFNALEYQGAGGPPGKSWNACPGLTTCASLSATLMCFSFSNDASLLLPSTAMTGNYRVAGHEGAILADPSTGATAPIGPTMAITATQDATSVKIQASATAQISSGTNVPTTFAGGTWSFSLDAGDVAELAAPGGMDFSGSLVQASAPVQVITAHPCIQIPPTEPACDHLEESVFPAETLGKDYVVTMPAGPAGTPMRHQVRIYGNVDGTVLTYNPSVPPGCPATIDAGEVVECGSPACPDPKTPVNASPMVECGTTSMDFEVTGTQPFSVGTFTLGAFLADPGSRLYGDPAQSFAIAVEQFRSTYVFLAPNDYTVSYLDVVAKTGTTLTLDGAPLMTAGVPIGTTGYVVVRAALNAGQGGAHTLNASLPVGIQVVGYGQYTSYMYPGGLDLTPIASAPPPIQ